MASEDNTPLRLRAHHVCCSRYWDIPLSERGEGFARTELEVRQALRCGTRPIQVVEGVDSLCSVCPLRSAEGCASPKGDETAVRKWDALLLRELGVPFGTVMDAASWRRLVDAKAPFRLCQRCQWRQHCSPGADRTNKEAAGTLPWGWRKERELAPGIVARLTWGDRVMLSLVRVEANSDLRLHSHPHEQAGVVLDGELQMVIGGENRTLKKGDAYVVASGVPHSARTGVVPALVLDTFSPPREDYK
ncbi:MAG: DUF1284 domain-containing protein [Chloroflexota bacterium]